MVGIAVALLILSFGFDIPKAEAYTWSCTCYCVDQSDYCGGAVNAIVESIISGTGHWCGCDYTGPSYIPVSARPACDGGGTLSCDLVCPDARPVECGVNCCYPSQVCSSENTCTYCGNGSCNSFESCSSCSADCGCTKPDVCYNSTCCTPVDCEISQNWDWGGGHGNGGGWGACSKACGGGTQSRTGHKDITQQASCGGTECPKPEDLTTTETQTCNDFPCNYELTVQARPLALSDSRAVLMTLTDWPVKGFAPVNFRPDKTFYTLPSIWPKELGGTLRDGNVTTRLDTEEQLGGTYGDYHLVKWVLNRFEVEYDMGHAKSLLFQLAKLSDDRTRDYAQTVTAKYGTLSLYANATPTKTIEPPLETQVYLYMRGNAYDQLSGPNTYYIWKNCDSDATSTTKALNQCGATIGGGNPIVSNYKDLPPRTLTYTEPGIYTIKAIATRGHLTTNEVRKTISVGKETLAADIWVGGQPDADIVDIRSGSVKNINWDTRNADR